MYATNALIFARTIFSALIALSAAIGTWATETRARFQALLEGASAEFVFTAPP